MEPPENGTNALWGVLNLQLNFLQSFLDIAPVDDVPPLVNMGSALWANGAYLTSCMEFVFSANEKDAAGRFFVLRMSSTPE